MPLTDTAVRSAKPRDRAYKLTDERGLHLHVTAQGSKLWRWAYRFDGKQKLMALGQYPDVSLAQARQARDDARKLLASGIDPMAQRKAAKVARRLAVENSFAAVARTWWESWKSARSASHVEYVWRRLEADVIPAIGARPVADIEAPELVAMMKAIERRGALDIAKRALQTTSQIFRYAIAHGMAMRNPAADIRPSDVLATRKKENYARIDAKELPALLRKVEMYQGAPTTRAAIRLMAMTFVRTSELIGARWDEFDLDAARWDIPAERMKMKTPHIVPLSTQAVSLLRSLHTLTGHSAFLFPGERDHGKPMSNNTILGALDRMGYKGRMTGHGFRGIASTLLHEQGWPHEHIELQLAHQERNRVATLLVSLLVLRLIEFQDSRFHAALLATCERRPPARCRQPAPRAFLCAQDGLDWQNAFKQEACDGKNYPDRFSSASGTAPVEGAGHSVEQRPVIGFGKGRDEADAAGDFTCKTGRKNRDETDLARHCRTLTH